MLKFLDELSDARVVWPGVEGETLTDEELDMLKYIKNSSPYFSYYLYRGTANSFLVLDACLSYQVNVIHYVDVAQEIADKLPGVDVYFSGDIHWRDSRILISVPKDLCSEVNDIQAYADSIMESQLIPGKPRLAVILDLEVGEKFKVCDAAGGWDEDTIFHVNSNGYFVAGTAPGSSVALCCAIQRPESIIRIARG